MSPARSTRTTAARSRWPNAGPSGISHGNDRRYVHVLGASKAFGNATRAAMLLGGAAGTLIGGQLADRFGRRAVLVGSMLVLPPLLAALQLSGPVLGVAFATLAGEATIATFAVTIVMGQEYLPGRLGVAAGVTIGLSIGLGGVGAPLLGLLADAHGLRLVFGTIAVLPLLALALTLMLPASSPRSVAPKRHGMKDS